MADTPFYSSPLHELNKMTSEMENDLKEFLEKHSITDLSIVGFNRFNRRFEVKCPNYLICKNWKNHGKRLLGSFDPDTKTDACEWCFDVIHIFEESKQCYKCKLENTTCVKLDNHEDCDYKLCIACYSKFKHGRILKDRPIFPYEEKLWYTYDHIAFNYLEEYDHTKEEFEEDLTGGGFLDEESDKELLKEALELYCAKNMIEKYPLLKDYLDAHKKHEDELARESSLIERYFDCPYCDERLQIYHFPEIIPLYADKGRDLVYEKENKIMWLRDFDDTPRESIKCKNYKLCKTPFWDNNYRNHSDYLCGGCRHNFGGEPPSKGELDFKESISCPVCLEGDETGVSFPRCDHHICIKCMRKCFYREDYPPFPIDDIMLQSEFEFNFSQQNEKHIVDFLKIHTELIDYYNEVATIELKFIQQNRSGNLRLCPLCRS